ncbi:MAG: 2-dehydropantoate 2-reductase, partial [Chloroflexi bacterium]|nr:2-dehydropantoate 2-reductase [Chloroflexota bacterium]
LRAIQANGLQVEAPDGNFTVTPRIATDDPVQVGVVDLVILGVKAWQVPEAARALLPMVGPETRVMTIQNGVEAPYQVAEVVPPERVIAGAIWGGATRVRPGCIRHIRPATEDSHIGQLSLERAGRTQPVARIQEILQGAGFRIAIPEDIRVPLWEKFVGYAGTGPAAACRAPLGVFRQVPESMTLSRQAQAETVSVARASGIALPEDLLESMERIAKTFPSTHMPSAGRDFLTGRPSEVVDFAGSVVRLGRAAGVPTPVNEFIYAVLLPQELKARGQIAWPE